MNTRVLLRTMHRRHSGSKKNAFGKIFGVISAGTEDHLFAGSGGDCQPWKCADARRGKSLGSKSARINGRSVTRHETSLYSQMPESYNTH